MADGRSVDGMASGRILFGGIDCGPCRTVDDDVGAKLGDGCMNGIAYRDVEHRPRDGDRPLAELLHEGRAQLAGCPHHGDSPGQGIGLTWCWEDAHRARV
jgi:hypothetical protein